MHFRARTARVGLAMRERASRLVKQVPANANLPPDRTGNRTLRRTFVLLVTAKSGYLGCDASPE